MQITDELIREDGEKLRSIILAYPHLLFTDDLIQRVSQCTYEWIIDEFDFMLQALHPFIERRTGIRQYSSYVFGYLLEYEGVNQAHQYIKQTGGVLDFDDFFSNGRLLRGAIEYISTRGAIPAGKMTDIGAAVGISFIKAVLEAGYKPVLDDAIYLFEYNELDKHDLFFSSPSPLIVEALERRTYDSNTLNQLLVLEEKGYKCFVPFSLARNKEVLRLAERTGYGKGFEQPRLRPAQLRACSPNRTMSPRARAHSPIRERSVSPVRGRRNW